MPRNTGYDAANIAAVMLAALLVAAIYALPLGIAYVRHGIVMQVSGVDDVFYGLRVADVARGGSLGNPYLFEHQNAPRWLPDLTEQSLGGLARFTGISPVAVLAGSRVVFPTAIFLLTLWLALDMGLDFPRALVAAGLAPLLPSIGHITRIPGTLETFGNFLRYFRLTSPPSYVMLFMVFVVALHAAWKRAPALSRSLVAFAGAAGITLGLLARTPMFYWTLAFTAVTFLAAFSPGRARVVTLVVLLTGLAIALPSLVHSFQMFQNPDVQASLYRDGQMLPGYRLEPLALARLVVSWVPILALLWFRRQISSAVMFLLPFFVPSSFFFIQNVVTGEQVQAYHWTSPLIPLWAVCAGLLAREMAPTLLRGMTAAVVPLLALACAGGSLQVLATLQWEECLAVQPETFALDLRMPHTLAWVKEHTPPDAVMFSNDEIMTSLPLYTGRKVFWSDAGRAGYYTLAESEYLTRLRYLDAAPAFVRPPPYRIDYYLGEGPMCRQFSRGVLVFADAAEHTCLLSLRQP